MFIERYDNGIGGNHIILESEQIHNVGYKARMLMENVIPDFLPCTVIRSDGKDEYVYDITSLISLHDLFECEEMDHKFLCCLINGIAAGLECAAEFLLPPEHILYDPRHIYIDRERLKILWCYYPGSYTTLTDGMNELAEYILNKADHKDEAAVSLAYGLYKQVVNEDYTLRKLVTQSSPTDPVSGKEDEGEDIFQIEDIDDFLLPSEDDAPTIPSSGKTIIGTCILILLFISAFTFTTSLYCGDSMRSLMEMTEMRLCLTITGTMAIMLPLLIILKWYKVYRKFRRTLDEAGNNKDDIYRKLSNDKNVQFGWEV